MLPLLGQLPSNAFAGIVEDDGGGGETPDSAITASQPTTTTTTTLESSLSYIGGNSAAMYKLKRDID